MQCAGIVLAAGGSVRLGEPKQLVTFSGETLVHAAVRAAQEGGCDPVCVVTGHAREEVEKAVADLNPVLVHNEDWKCGMGSSVRLGVRAVQEAGRVILLTCDQPSVDGEVVRGLLAMHDGCGTPIVASRYAGAMGVPAVFARSRYVDLMNLPAEGGAKSVIRKDLFSVTPFEFPGGAYDLDTRGDLRAWRGRYQQGRIRDLTKK